MATASYGFNDSTRMTRTITVWSIVSAVLLILLGMCAIIEPAVAGLGVSLLVGWLLLIGGIFHLIAAFKGGGAARIIFQILIGLAYLAGGIYFLTHPLIAIGMLTLILAGVILASGVLEIISYFRLRKELASGWLLLSGIVTVLVGGMIWYQWPSSSVWAIGTLVGVNLLMAGMARLMLGLATRRPDEPAAAEPRAPDSPAAAA